MMYDGYQIFISYRRHGTDAHARVFYEKLKAKGFSVFLDFESLFSGGFEDHILEAIDGCTDFILLLPKNGLSRCSEEDDLLRKEIKRALDGKKNIIPVFVDGFKMPKEDKLPKDIAALSHVQGVVCTMNYFNAVFDSVFRKLNSKPKDAELYEVLQELQSRALGLKHEYFKKWTCMKLRTFLSDNDDFFDGTNRTNPHSEDTFGVAGIAFTKKSIKAITGVSDYWQDPFTIAYLERQKELIKNGAEITRVFILEPGQYDSAKAQMQYQSELGIKVSYIYKGNEYIDPTWLVEDYMIQDDALLVEITCQSHKFDETYANTEKVTTNVVEVRTKVERFQRILERSIRFVPEVENE